MLGSDRLTDFGPLVEDATEPATRQRAQYPDMIAPERARTDNSDPQLVVATVTQWSLRDSGLLPATP